MRVAGDGKARLFLLRDSLLSRDVNLAEKRLPVCTEEEIESYIWNEKKDEPVKQHDHGMDAMRYVVMGCEEVSDGIYV